jgi:ankyrin repeat protein
MVFLVLIQSFESPLHHAAEKGNFEIVKRLIEAGADVDILDQ